MIFKDRPYNETPRERMPHFDWAVSLYIRGFIPERPRSEAHAKDILADNGFIFDLNG